MDPRLARLQLHALLANIQSILAPQTPLPSVRLCRLRRLCTRACDDSAAAFRLWQRAAARLHDVPGPIARTVEQRALVDQQRESQCLALPALPHGIHAIKAAAPLPKVRPVGVRWLLAARAAAARSRLPAAGAPLRALRAWRAQPDDAPANDGDCRRWIPASRGRALCSKPS